MGRLYPKTHTVPHVNVCKLFQCWGFICFVELILDQMCKYIHELVIFNLKNEIVFVLLLMEFLLKIPKISIIFTKILTKILFVKSISTFHKTYL